jgi:hypothetical protein
MKKQLLVAVPVMILALTFASCTTSAIPASSPAQRTSPVQQPSSTQQSLSAQLMPTFIVGDVNHDGVVDMGDVIKIERIILGFDPPTEAADVNGDGVVDIRDILQIERIMLGQK